VVAKKSLGQHWLQDSRILRAIADDAKLTATDVVLEIGPGKGTLTRILAQHAAELIALEVDADLLPHLRKIFKDTKNVRIEHTDIRTYNLNTLPKKYKIIANIPYYLTSNLIRQITDAQNKPERSALLMQKEVAVRICAKPGKMSVLANIAQLNFECSLGTPVAAEYFSPPPKVDSQVLVMKLRDQPLIDVDQQQFIQLLKAGFSSKRKSLRNSLSAHFSVEKGQADKWLEQASIDPTRRAQTLTFSEWRSLFAQVDVLYSRAA